MEGEIITMGGSGKKEAFYYDNSYIYSNTYIL